MSLIARLIRVVREEPSLLRLRFTRPFHSFCRIYAGFGAYMSGSRDKNYDELTFRIMKKVLEKDSNCVDVGSHTGYILRAMCRYAPSGRHIGIEPIPFLATELRTAFPKATIIELAMSDKDGEASFQLVESRTAMSGLGTRKMESERTKVIKVRTARLDDIYPHDQQLHFMKIDVEGAEYLVLKGAEETIRRTRPHIVFEHGKGGADAFGVAPGDVYDFLSTECDLRVSTLSGFLDGRRPLDRGSFTVAYDQGLEYVFLAHP